MSQQEYLYRAKTLIDRHYDLPLDLAQLSEQACFSRYHFLRLFRQTFDATPHQYLTRRRIERARELLVATDLSVTEVCMTVGFQSLGSFSTLFQKYTGHSPQRYRTRVFQGVSLAKQAAPYFVPACYLYMYGVDYRTQT